MTFVDCRCRNQSQSFHFKALANTMLPGRLDRPRHVSTVQVLWGRNSSLSGELECCVNIGHVGSHPSVTAKYLTSENQWSLSWGLKALVSELPFKSEAVLVAFHCDRVHRRSISMAELFAHVCVEAGLTAQFTHLCHASWAQSHDRSGSCIECLADTSSNLRGEDRKKKILAALLGATRQRPRKA